MYGSCLWNFRYSVLANECTVLVLRSCVAEKLLSQPRTASHTTESSGGEKVVGGEKVKNLLDCNPDKPEGKAARTKSLG